MNDVDRVLGARSYWDPGSEEHARWLRELLPQVRSFLESHRAHAPIYAEGERFLDIDSPSQFDWIQLAGSAYEAMPRQLAGALALSSWPEVEAWVAAHGEPWWWQHFPEQKEWARAKFEALVRARSASN